ncbi:MAG TPA: ATP-binding protein [Cyclobacteriaceae bacterium]|nr:ATP-binding protein [Cyclobacteriaceae bacterium]
MILPLIAKLKVIAHMINARKFMQMAIDEMQKSIPEKRHDGKASPKVGAVLVSEKGELLGAAHRGELREGDHAEFTLLEKKFRDTNVTGCILFATLEPCAKGARKPPKVECAQRIVDARIKKVYIGIEDPDPTVGRTGLKYLEESGIEVEMFDKDLQELIENENKQFLKEANLRAKEVTKPKLIELSTLERKVEQADMDEFSSEALELYINRAELNTKADSAQFLALLEQQELIKIESKTERNSEVDDSFRRNDVKPIFKKAGGHISSGEIEDKFKNEGDRANILSFREMEGNTSYINITTGWVDRGQEFKITARSKIRAETNRDNAYHIEISYTDKDGRNYRQEFSRKGTDRSTVSEPELIEATKKRRYIPTGLGILLFGKNPRLRYPQAVLKVEARYGSSEPEIQDFNDALVLIPDKVEFWLKKVLQSRISRDQFARTTEYDYPIDVLREAIINALVHRDYEIEGAKCSLFIDDEKIVIKSPGYPVKPIKFEDLKAFKAPSLSRNPKIMAVFNAMDYVEERGIGMREMKLLPSKHQLPLPEIEWLDPFVSITFARNPNYLLSQINPDILRQLNEEETAGFLFVRDNSQVTKSQYASHFSFNEKKAQRHLTKLKELGLVNQVGKGKAIRYMFSGNH